MMMVDSSENDEDFNEDIYCDSCHQMWPEIVYIEHWEMCMSEKISKKEQQADLNFREEELKLQLSSEREGTVEKQKRQKKTGRGRRAQITERSTIQQKQPKLRPRRTINTQKKEKANLISSLVPRKSQTKKQADNGEQIQCNDCRKSMSMQQFQNHPRFCESPSSECPFCHQNYGMQLIFLHKLNCRPQPSQSIASVLIQLQRQQSSGPQQNPPMSQQYTNQFLEFLQSQWNEAKNRDKGLNDSEFGELAAVKYKKKGEEADTCTICQDDIEQGSDSLHLPCKHIFHLHCIKQWVKKNASCPNCKFNIKESIPANK